jgi:hypothetical protein
LPYGTAGKSTFLRDARADPSSHMLGPYFILHPPPTWWANFIMSAETYPKVAGACILTSSVWPGSWITSTRPKAFLREFIHDLSGMDLIPSTTFGPTRGTQEAEGFLGEVPWGGGNLNTTQVRASALKSEPVATFRATFRPIEIVPSVCTVSHSLRSLSLALICRSTKVKLMARSDSRHASRTHMCY